MIVKSWISKDYGDNNFGSYYEFVLKDKKIEREIEKKNDQNKNKRRHTRVFNIESIIIPDVLPDYDKDQMKLKNRDIVNVGIEEFNHGENVKTIYKNCIVQGSKKVIIPNDHKIGNVIRLIKKRDLTKNKEKYNSFITGISDNG